MIAALGQHACGDMTKSLGAALRRSVDWLRGLATTLTCSSMRLDLKHRYGGVGKIYSRTYLNRVEEAGLRLVASALLEHHSRGRRFDSAWLHTKNCNDNNGLQQEHFGYTFDKFL
jgi:hypothetical protein